MQPWYELMRTEPEPIIFSYLLFLGPDYGYNISKTFQAAISENIWEDTRGRQTLKNPNLVSATLKEMEKNGLLIKREENRRTYYTANIDVIRSPSMLDKPDDQHVVCGETTFNVLDKSAASLIIETLQKLEIDRSKFIKYLNHIERFDYLTILAVFNEIITRFTYYISLGIYENSIHMTFSVSYQNMSEDEIRKDLTRFFTIEPQEMAELEMKNLNLQKMFLEENQKNYTGKLIEIGYNEENLNNYFYPLKIAALPAFQSINLNETIVKIVYMERGVPNVPTKKSRITPSP
jgi:hypothetical protein